MPVYPDEETSLLSGGGKPKAFVASYSVNIEWFRFWGLMGGAVLLTVGTFLTIFFVTIPEQYSAYYNADTGTVDGGPEDVMREGSTFYYKQTLIYTLFHFNHTCSMLDFNPAKTISALIIMAHIIPTNIFVVLDYLRISKDPEISTSLKSFTKFASPFQFVSICYFFMVFVNSPYGNAVEDPAAMNRFIAHYVPYVAWQVGMLIMGAQQIWYVLEKDAVVQLPLFGFFGPVVWPKLTKGWMYAYLVYLSALTIVYTTFVSSFIMSSGQKPLWCTNEAEGCEMGNKAAHWIMYGWDISAVLIPTMFSLAHARDGPKSVIEFSHLD